MSRPRVSILWITDPWTTLDHSRDSTIRMMEEASRLGIKQHWCNVKSIRLEKDKVCLDSQEVISVDPDRSVYEWGPLKVRRPTEFTQIVYRTDPPVDLPYLHPLHLLSLSLSQSKSKTEIINPLGVLFSGNEKMEAAAIPGLMPESLVSSQWEQHLKFGKAHQRTVLKPLHEAQSHGIELLDWRTTDGQEQAKIQLELATRRFQTPVLLQIYLEGIIEGETRLWFLDGKLLAHAKKMPIQGDFRVDIDRGSRLVSAPLSRSEKNAMTRISKYIRSKKIRMAAIDLIEGHVTDFNFTSPGLIRQMEAVLGVNLAQEIVKAL